MPFLDGVAETFHALISPYAHHGQVNWRGDVRENDTFALAPSDPGGPLVVITSAGFESRAPDVMPRIVRFLNAVYAIQDYYMELPGNIRQAVYSGVGVDGGDGMTVTLWQSDAAMMQAANKNGAHRSQMDVHKEVMQFDRSSFTRGRIIDSKGTWNGSNPVSELLN